MCKLGKGKADGGKRIWWVAELLRSTNPPVVSRANQRTRILDCVSLSDPAEANR